MMMMMMMIFPFTNQKCKV